MLMPMQAAILIVYAYNYQQILEYTNIYIWSPIPKRKDRRLKCTGFFLAIQEKTFLYPFDEP